MLARAKTAWKWISATDTALSWAERVSRILGVSAGIGLVSAVIAWVVQNFYAALVIGLAVWLFAMMGLLAKTTRQADSRVPLVAESDTEDETPPMPPTDPEDVGQLRTQLDEAEQRIDELQKLLAANRPPQHFKTPVETVDLRTTDEAKEIEAEKEELNTEIEELKTQLEEAQQTIRSQRNAMEDEQGVVHWGEFQAREIGVSVDTAALKAENEQLKRQNEELTQRLDERKRERIEKWRSVIRDFDFETERFAETDSYSQMKQCGLKPEVIDMFEAQRTVHVGNEAREDTAYKSTLLDEVARIENERVLNAPEVANDKESLRHRCILLGQELLQFMKVHGYSDETVNRFVQRHEWKVNELRDELDERAWLTTQERDTLTFHADDYSHKIEEIANTLVLLGRGH